MGTAGVPTMVTVAEARLPLAPFAQSKPHNTEETNMKALLLNGRAHKAGCTYTALKVLVDTLEVRRCAGVVLPAQEARLKMCFIRFQMRHLPYWRKEHMKDKDAMA